MTQPTYETQRTHIDDLQRESKRLARHNCELNRRVTGQRRRVWALEVIVLICIATTSWTGAMWYKNMEARASQERITELTVRGLSYALSSEQSKAGNLSYLLERSQDRLHDCRERADNAEATATAAATPGFVGEVQTLKEE